MMPSFRSMPEFIKTKSLLLQRIRHYFYKNDYHEVDTPAIVQHPGLEFHIEAFPIHSVQAKSPWGEDPKGPAFLHTSPEFSMKKLLSPELPKIFQIAKVFRDEPLSPLHRRDFLMLEFYKLHAD